MTRRFAYATSVMDMVVGEVIGGLSRAWKKYLCVPGGHYKHFEKFKKKTKVLKFQDFPKFSGSGTGSALGHPAAAPRQSEVEKVGEIGRNTTLACRIDLWFLPKAPDGCPL